MRRRARRRWTASSGRTTTGTRCVCRPGHMHRADTQCMDYFRAYRECKKNWVGANSRDDAAMLTHSWNSCGRTRWAAERRVVGHEAVGLRVGAETTSSYCTHVSIHHSFTRPGCATRRSTTETQVFTSHGSTGQFVLSASRGSARKPSPTLTLLRVTCVHV